MFFLTACERYLVLIYYNPGKKNCDIEKKFYLCKTKLKKNWRHYER